MKFCKTLIRSVAIKEQNIEWWTKILLQDWLLWKEKL